MLNQTSKLVVNVIGYPGCGKSSLCALLADQGFYVHRPSDVLRAYAAEHGIQLNGRQDYVKVHHMLNEDNPLAIVIPVISSEQSRICIDGLRSPVLLERLQTEVEHVVTIALACPIEERFRRIQADDLRRGTHRAPSSLEAFQTDELPDYTNPDRNLPNMTEMMTKADYTIDADQQPLGIAIQLNDILNSKNLLDVITRP